MAEIIRSTGVSIGATGTVVGGGYSAAVPELGEFVDRAAELLAEAYAMPVMIRYNSDRHSGGAWLVTHVPDGIWRNAEVGVTAHYVTAEQHVERLARYTAQDDAEALSALGGPGLHAGLCVSERAMSDPTAYHLLVPAGPSQALWQYAGTPEQAVRSAVELAAPAHVRAVFPSHG